MKKISKKILLLLFALLVMVPQQIIAQKQKDYEAALTKPREFGKGYILKDGYYSKVPKFVEKMGWVILCREYPDLWFIPQEEYEDWKNEITFAQYFMRELELRAKGIEFTNTSSYRQVIPKEERVNANLTGSDFKSTGSVYFYESDAKGLVMFSNAKWTGSVVNGMLQGSGDGFVAIETTDKGNVYRSFSGTFKNGFPCGDVTFVKMTPECDKWRVKYWDLQEKCFRVGETHEGLASFKEFSWKYAYRGPYTKNFIHKCGFFDASGNIALKPIYQDIKKDFDNGKAIVVMAKMDVIINNKGEFINLDKNTTTITEGLFSEHGNKAYHVKYVNLPNSIEKIASKAFRGNKVVENIVFPKGLKEIGNEAFLCCKSLKEIIIPSTVTEIGNQAFWGCDNLTSATLPASLINNIEGKLIFKNCNKLKEVNVIDANGKITKDSNWYWKEEKSPESIKKEKEEKIKQKEIENKKIENSDDYRRPDRIGDFKSTLLDIFDIFGSAADEAYVAWDNPSIVETVYKKDSTTYYFKYNKNGNQVNSPMYRSFEDVIAAIWFYYVHGKKRTKGIRGSYSW